MEHKNYKILETGQVYSIKRKRIMSPGDNGKGYKFLFIYSDIGIKKRYYVHRLIAELYMPNPNNYKEINHKDGNKGNNHKDNLEWVNRSMNNKHAFATGLNKPRNMQGANNPNYRHGKRIKPISSLKSEREFASYQHG